MWKDKLKGLFQDVCKELGDACDDVKEKVESANISEKIKQVGEDILEGVEKANIGEKLKNVGDEIKAQFMPGNESTASSSNAKETVIDVSWSEKAENADTECALSVPAEDGERGEGGINGTD